MKGYPVCLNFSFLYFPTLQTAWTLCLHIVLGPVCLRLSRGTNFAAELGQAVVDLKIDDICKSIIIIAMAQEIIHDLAILNYSLYHWAKCFYKKLENLKSLEIWTRFKDLSTDLKIQADLTN